MGVQNLWKALQKGGAVEVFEGNQPGAHAEIVEAVENKVVAVDLSAWLMQAQTQPALLEYYDSPYARAVKVVFDRTIHWLRYGVLPVFVIEGRTPAAKLDKLRARCVAQYGPSSYSYDVGNRAGGQFDRLGQAVKRLLEAFGVPVVQAVGEAEAMCAALNVCGWAHAVHTADVDALLFGALTVYRQLHLQTDDPRKSNLTRCCMYDVRRVLGISSGGDAALMAVAHLAGGDYDLGGADNVGEVLALGAVRQLLADCDDDELVLQRLEAALAAGPDPELDALTKCTGCKACGHEGNRKNRINSHSARNGCAACGCEDGCVPRDFQQCECSFHARADERLLNRVVRRAAATPNFMSGFKTAAATYADQTRSAIASIQREYGLPAPGSSSNVFSWRSRPNVRAISDIMCGYIKDWDYRQVRLKLLPLLLEWDIRQGPAAQRGFVQFRPSSIRKVSSKGTEAADVPMRLQKGWRYVLTVDRLPDSSDQQAAGAAGGAAGAASGGAGGAGMGWGGAGLQADPEDAAIDQSWLAGTARTRPPKQSDAGGFSSMAASQPQSQLSPPPPQQQQQRQQQVDGLDSIDLVAGGDDSYEGEAFLSTQLPGGSTQPGLGSPMVAGRGFSSSSQQQASQAGGGSGGAGNNSRLAEHRSVRCSLIDAVWPHLTAAFRQPAASSGGRSRSASAGRKKKAAGAGDGAAAAAAAGGDKQRTVKDFFSVAKDYTTPGRHATKLPAAEGGDIPGLAGIASGVGALGRGAGRPAVVVAAAAAAGSTTPVPAAAAEDDGRTPSKHRAAAAADKPSGSFMEWLAQQQQGLQHQQTSSRVQPAAAPEQQQQQQHRGRASSSKPASSPVAAAVSRRARKKQTVAKTPCKAGPLDRFLRPAAAGAAGGGLGADELDKSRQQQQQQQPRSPAPVGVLDGCDSPEIPSLAARLAAKAAAAQASSPRSRPRPDSPADDDSGGGDAAGPTMTTAAAAAAAGAAADRPQSSSDSRSLLPPAKKASTDLAKVLLSSPVQRTPPRAAAAAAGSSPAAAAAGGAGYYSQYQALLEQMGVASPEEEQKQQPAKPGRGTVVKGLFVQDVEPQKQRDHPAECIELLDSPMPTAAAAAALEGGAETPDDDVEVVDLT